MRFYTLSLWVSFQLSLHVEGNLYCLVMLLRKTHKAWKWVSTISRFWLGHEIQAWDFKMMSTISSFWLFMHETTISSFWLFKCETSKWCPLYRVFDFSSARIQTGVIHYIIFVTFSHEIHAWDFKRGVLYDLGLQIPNFWNMYVWKVGVTWFLGCDETWCQKGGWQVK